MAWIGICHALSREYVLLAVRDEAVRRERSCTAASSSLALACENVTSSRRESPPLCFYPLLAMLWLRVTSI